MKTLEERVASLEKSNRRWRYGAALLVLTVASIAASKPDTTRRLAVVNDKNVVVAEIGATADGDGQMRILDRAGRQPILFEAKGGGPLSPGGTILMNGADGTPCFRVDVYQDHCFANVWGHLSAVNTEKTASTTMDGGSIKIGHLSKGGDREKDQRVYLGVLDADANGGGAVQVFNTRGKIAAEMQSSKANAGLIMANDFDGNAKQSLSGAK
jgi:hypothetical protein